MFPKPLPLLSLFPLLTVNTEWKKGFHCKEQFVILKSCFPAWSGCISIMRDKGESRDEIKIPKYAGSRVPGYFVWDFISRNKFSELLWLWYPLSILLDLLVYYLEWRRRGRYSFGESQLDLASSFSLLDLTLTGLLSAWQIPWQPQLQESHLTKSNWSHSLLPHMQVCWFADFV